ncbi:MAG: hypothetical protein ACK5C0_00825 [Candidatus Kapaibacterium sp.]|jgi:S-formylglutathione hydrolase FrmB
MNTLKFLCSIAILSSILPYYLMAQETYTVRLSQTNSDAFIATSSQIGLPNGVYTAHIPHEHSIYTLSFIVQK